MPSTVTKVFLSSTAKDLKEYREVVYRAIDQMDGYKCVGMEGFGARPRTPAEECVGEVVDCDLLVGIIGPFYGSNPADNTKSFTEIEYDAAVDKGIEPLIFLTPEGFLPPANISEPEARRKRQQAFRERLRQERTVSSNFSTPDELARIVVLSIKNWEGRPRRTLPPNPANHIPQMCDRQHQEATFLMFRREGSRHHREFPQFYFVHGEESENHRSFVLRLCRTRIQEFANARSRSAGAKVTLHDVEWPQRDEPAARRELLLSALFEKLDVSLPHSDDEEFSANTLRGLLVRSLDSVLVFQHNIPAEEWDDETPGLLRWYMEFWDAVKGDAVIPQCFIFFNVVYPQAPRGPLRPLRRWNPLGVRKRVQRAARAIAELHVRKPKNDSVHCPCAMLSELTCVKKEHLMTWLSKNRPGDNEAAWAEYTARIMTDNRGRLLRCRSMRDVETHLTDLHDESIGSTPGVR